MARGVEASWYQARELSEEQREVFRQRSSQSQLARIRAEKEDVEGARDWINTPNLDPNELMPQIDRHGLRCLSLFSGGGGLDLGFDRAGYFHVGSYELLEFAGDTLRMNRPDWEVFSGDDGDVTRVDWTPYEGVVDVVHGGPPCQPFSMAGRQNGKLDPRDMFPEFVRAVQTVKPRAFVAENVAGLDTKKFAEYIDLAFLSPLSDEFEITKFLLNAADFGVPQQRRRVFFVGIRKDQNTKRFAPPEPTHQSRSIKTQAKQLNKQPLLIEPQRELPMAMGVREALGLPDTGIDAPAPTLRCTLTGPRATTSVLSSTAAQKVWSTLEVWPNGVSADREIARRFPTKNGHFRMAVDDCKIIQGFPDDWKFSGPAYKALGQIGNSVAPPVGYAVARAISKVFLNHD